MIRKEDTKESIFDKANSAATNAMQSVVDLASRTSTPVIVYRDGKIVRIEPKLLQKPAAPEVKNEDG
jgi:hypothetical protein